ncbi:MAG: hypothetical protein IPG93_10070 [Burkholderiales bacterium]|nr:hypothetical protein [Burkholderiales bacterium]
MSQISFAPSSFHADISRVIKYVPARLIGRKTETKLLSEAWEQVAQRKSKRTHVLTFVALGGEGKTSLVVKWAAELAHQGWPACEAAFAWSFYHQGSDEKTADSSEVFLNEALILFGDPTLACSDRSAADKGRRLAQLVGQRRALIILDGVETLQYAPTSPRRGELKDAGLATLLKGLAADNLGLCVVTTRYSIPDLQAYWQTSAQEIKLPRLTKAAGVALLRALGVDGRQQEFHRLVEDVKGHALTLNLLGSYLHEAHGGDIRKRDLVKLEQADDEQGGHAFRVMDAYVKWLESDGEKGERALAVLRLLGLFDRPASADCLAVLFQAPVILDLTEPIVGISDEQRNLVFSRLESARLLTVNRSAVGSLISIDAHPLLREYFAKQLKVDRVKERLIDSLMDEFPKLLDEFPKLLDELPKLMDEFPKLLDEFPKLLDELPKLCGILERCPEEIPEAWRGGHRRLFQHLCQTTREGDSPTLEDLQPLYQAIVHGCKAGMQQSAFQEDSIVADTLDLFYKRIHRDGASMGQLGAVGAELGALAAFFDTPWSQISDSLAGKDRLDVLILASKTLTASGRLTEAMELMNALPKKLNFHFDNKSALVIECAGHSQLMLLLGDVDGAVRNAEMAETYIPCHVPLAEIGQKMYVLAMQANALHQAGRRIEADARFREAEKLVPGLVLVRKLEERYDFSGDVNLLFSDFGFWYCDLLLDAAERAAWQCFIASASFRPTISSIGIMAPQSYIDAKSIISCEVAGSCSEKAKRGSEHAPTIQACSDVFRRASQTLRWITPKKLLREIALDQLTLGRTALYQAILERSSLNRCRTFVEHAVEGMRRAGQEVHLPSALLTRALLHSLSDASSGGQSNSYSAQSDLDEAWEIAERGPMPLFMVDIHLYRARLFGPLAPGASGKKYPWKSAGADLAAARQLIEKHGYLRRLEELEDAEVAARRWLGSAQYGG